MSVRVAASPPFRPSTARFLMSGLLMVGEAWGEQEEFEQAPFVGPSGDLLRSMCRQARIPWDEVHLTNVFNLRPPGNRILALCGASGDAIPDYINLQRGQYVKKAYQPEIDRLWKEIETLEPSCIVALGGTALWALCNVSGIKNHRGSGMVSRRFARTVIPTWHPAAVLRNWKLRTVTVADLCKAKQYGRTGALPNHSGTIVLEPSLEDIERFYEERAKKAPFLACDIETLRGTITMIGFASARDHALVIPFYRIPGRNYWPTRADEVRAWEWVRKLCQLPLVGQNFSYDSKYLWRTVGIECPNWIGDTMLLHHALEPELEKGLGFLGSVYTDRPIWKQLGKRSREGKKGD